MKTPINVYIDECENIVISYENEDYSVHEFETPLVNALPDFIGGLSEPDFKLLDRQIQRCGNHYEIIYRLFSAGGVPVILGVIEINDEFINDSLPFDGRKTMELLDDFQNMIRDFKYYTIPETYLTFSTYDEAQKYCKTHNLDFNLIRPQWKT